MPKGHQVFLYNTINFYIVMWYNVFNLIHKKVEQIYLTHRQGPDS